MTTYAPGTPCWVDLATPDMDASLAFYGGLFGWTATEGAEEAGGYRTFLDDGRGVAGIVRQQSPGQPKVWTTWISVDDCDEAVRRIGAAGGSILMSGMDVLDLGRMAIFTDPQGAYLAVWEPRAMPGAERRGAVGSVCWTELHTSDRAAASAFYGEVFGWDGADEQAGGHPYTVFSVGGRPVAGAGGEAETPHWLTWFGVVDADASVERATELGGTLSWGPGDIEGVGRTAIVLDPHGAEFGLLQPETPGE